MLDNTFEIVAAKWMDTNRDWSEGYRNNIEKRLANHAYPIIGNIPVTAITRDDLIKIINRLDSRKLTSSTIAKTHQNIINILDYAIAHGLIVTNIARDIKPLIPKGDEIIHHPALNIKDVPEFLIKLENSKCQYETIVAMKLLMLTASRPHQIFAATWNEIDFEKKEWIFAKQRMKKRKIHIAPLPTQAIELLQELKLINGRVKYLFPQQKDSKKHMHPNTLKNAIQQLGYDAVAHGMRTLFSTWANGYTKIKFNQDAIECQIAHKEKDLSREAYNRANYMDERIVMVQVWADYLDAIKADGDALQFKKAG